MGYRVVITDDEPIIRLDLSQMLESRGMEVVGEASDGFDAVELCRERTPDVVLMDIRMPLFDGLKAAQTLLKEQLTKVVLIVSAFSEPDLVRKAAEIGAGGYLVKPIEERDLFPAIEIALSQYARRKALEENAEQLRQELQDRAMIDRAKSIIAKENQVPEAEAYRMLQRLSMDKRRTMGVLARSIVEQNDQRALVNRAKRMLMEQKGLSEREAFRAIQAEAEKRSCTAPEAAEAILEGGKTP